MQVFNEINALKLKSSEISIYFEQSLNIYLFKVVNNLIILFPIFDY